MTCSGVAVVAHSQQKQHAGNVTPSGAKKVQTGHVVHAGSATGRMKDSTIAASSHLRAAVLVETIPAST